MEDNKHTPGPWSYQPAMNYGGFSIAPLGTLPTLASIESVTGGSNIKVECFNFPGATEPNARLISAAPELLEACQYAQGAVRTMAALDKLRNAIRKATGGK